MKIFIYKLLDPVTLEVRYVGKTNMSLNKRFSNHIYKAKHNPTTHNAKWILSLLKQGKKPKLEIIEICNKDTWQEREQFWISFYPNLTNHTIGGDTTEGYKHTEETKEKLRGKKKPLSEEHKKLISAALLGRIFTEEHKNKISKSNMGKTMSEKNKKLLSERCKNKPLSKETKQKIAEKLTGKKRPDEVREKISRANKGKILTEETKQKLRLCNLGKKQSEEVRCKKSKYTTLQYTLDGVFVKEWKTTGYIQEELGFLKGNIQSCIAGRLKTAYGFKWSKKEDIVQTN